jgi:hypothetical protein
MARAEIERQQAALRARDDELTKELARLYRESQKGLVSAPVLDANALAARQVAAKLLNGSTPAGLVPADASANIKLEQHLMNEREGVRIAMRILSDKSIEARAVEAVEWLESHRAELNELRRDHFLTAAKSNAISNRIADLFKTCPDIHAVRIENGGWMEHIFCADKVLEEMTNDMIEAGTITASDVKKAKAK